MTEDSNKGFVLWFTGLPCSGKTTVADKVAQELKKHKRNIERLDGDIMRKTLCSDLGFSKQDRDENIKRIIFLTEMLSRNNVAVLASFISPYRQKRREARTRSTGFIEIFLDCPVEICEERDVKGMYKKARAGAISDFTGISSPYEMPATPEIILNTASETVEESSVKVIDYLKSKGYIK